MFLGIDLGTSEVKLLLLDEHHRVLATSGAPLTVSNPQPLWSEQHPHDWWAALEHAMQRLRERAPVALAAVQAIGLSGQMHGAVLLDAAGQVLRPAILWNDGRSAAQCAQLEAAAPRLQQIAGNLAMPGFTAPKLLWLREHERALFDRVATVLLPKDWLRWRLSGERWTDASDASGTLWLDCGARRWSAELLAACGLCEAQMPQVVEGSSPAGRLQREWARRWGLREGVPIAGGGGDNAASAVGIGALRAGQGFVSLGTSGVIFLVGDRFQPNPRAAVHAFCHALPGRWHQMAVMLSAASALRWCARVLGVDDEAALVSQAEALTDAQRARAPLFLPYLSGERTPHNDAGAQAAWVGLTHAHDRADLAHAVLEGVAFGLLDGWQVLDAGLRQCGAPLALVGGGARSEYWARMLASLLERELMLHEGAETAAALGAARLAWLAAGGGEDDVCRALALRRRIEPEPAWRDAMRPRHERFRALYRPLREACS